MKLAGAVVLLAYAAIVASVRPFTWPALALVAIPALVVVAMAVPGLRGREGIRPVRRGLVQWAVLAAAVAAWELLAFVQSPRDSHPTLSSMLDAFETNRPARAALFVAWLALGRELARR